MPKEVIYSEQAPYGDDDPRRSIAELSWSREAEHVQFATLFVEGSTLERLPLKDIEGGIFIQLDRPGINRLIRYLRRARDQTFGRDE